jgi:hypothetical protein
VSENNGIVEEMRRAYRILLGIAEGRKALRRII